MNKKRLLKLADFLDTVPRRSFNMDNWVTREATGPEGDTPGECGFAGCALGWAAHGKLFAQLRLDGCNRPTYRRTPGSRLVARHFSAAVELFDIESSDADHLFGNWFGRAVTPHQEARRIREFVARGRPL